MGNCTEKREQIPCFERKKQQGMIHFYPTFDLVLPETEATSICDETFIQNDQDYFDKQFAIDQAQEMKNIIKIQSIRAKHQQFQYQQLLIEIGYVNVKSQIRIKSYPNKLKPQKTKYGQYLFQVFKWTKNEDNLQETQLCDLIEQDYIIVECLNQEEQMIGYQQIPFSILMDQKVKETEIDLIQPVKLDTDIKIGQFRGPYKIWIRMQYLYDLKILHQQQKSQLQSFRQQYDI
ncbi:hypothetical protein pb186bvf_018486 [Paramecium bursaria]